MSDLLSIYNELQTKKWVDLTHKINAESPHFPALPALKQEDLFTLKDGFHVQKFTVVGQYGTHIDAPIHFVEDGRWLDEIDLKDLLLPLYVIDKSKEVAANPNFILSKWMSCQLVIITSSYIEQIFHDKYFWTFNNFNLSFFCKFFFDNF
mgnify:CR=1 FL=1